MKRSALTIGINNYPGHELQGCVNDATDWAAVWSGRDFDEVLTLTDSEASTAAMVGEMERLVSGLKYRDTLVVCYSGHGSWVPDDNGDEADGRDEVWLGQDFADQGYIKDDELYEIFGARAFGSRVYVISDSCFSGTVSRAADLAFNRETVPDTGNEDGKPADRIRYLPPGNFLQGQQYARALDAQLMDKTSKPRKGTVLFSGCDETEYSYDAWFQGLDSKWRANGAFTRTAIDALNANPTASVKQWFSSIRRGLPSEQYPQAPQLNDRLYQNYWKLP